MQRNIIITAILCIFIITFSIIENFVYENKPDKIYDLEGEQKIVNEKYITAQILSQRLDNVYQVFQSNLADISKQSENTTMVFLDELTDILNQLDIKTISMKPIQSNKRKNYTLDPYRLEIECSYEKYGKFIAELERNDRLIFINEFSLNNSYDRIANKNKEKKLNNQMIRMEIATITLKKQRS